MIIFLNICRKSFLQKKYRLYQSASLISNGEVSIYIKPPNIFSTSKCFIIVHTQEITEEFKESIYASIRQNLSEYYPNKRTLFPKIDTIEIICMLCVDKITSAFNKWIADSMPQFVKISTLPVGVCFDKQSISFAIPKTGSKVVLKKMRKEVIRILRK